MSMKNLDEVQAECPDLFTTEEWKELEATLHPPPVAEPEPSMVEEVAQPVAARDAVAIAYLAHTFPEPGVIPAPARTGLPFRLPGFSEPPYEHRFKTDRSGTEWEFLPPDTPVKSGDEVDEGGIWRPKRSLRRYARRYDRAHFQHQEDEAHHAKMLSLHGADSIEAIESAARLAEALTERQAALDAANDPVIKERDRADAWRREHPEEYNASRRTTQRGPNADLSGMTDDEKRQHERSQSAERQRIRRAKKKAAQGTSEGRA